MHRFFAKAILVAGVGVLVFDVGCGSFGSASDSSPADAAMTNEAGAVDADGAAVDGSPADAGPGPKFCDDKASYVICSDYEGPAAGGTEPILERGWGSLDVGAGVAIDLVPNGDGNHGLHWQVPDLAVDAVDAKGLHKELTDVPSTLTFAASLQMGINSDTQYTEVFYVGMPEDSRNLQLVVQMTDGGDLKLVESSKAAEAGGRTEVTLGALGTVRMLKPIRIEVRLTFGNTNTVQVLVDGVPQAAASPLQTAPTAKPTGKVVFATGYIYTKGGAGKSGGGFYVDDITLQTTP